MSAPHPFLKWFKRVSWCLAASAGLAALAIWGANAWVVKTAQASCHDVLADVPRMKAAVVMGCAPKIGNQHNLFYQFRIQAAVDLYRAGKVEYLIVSGDNGTHAYDEPTAMKASLVAAGVPESAIYCDYAGFRTLDSVVRAQAIFGQEKFLVISQKFHNERAVFLARQRGLEAVGYNARDLNRRAGMATHLREYLARVKAALDVSLLGTEPKFYGPGIELGTPQPPKGA